MELEGMLAAQLAAQQPQAAGEAAAGGGPIICQVLGCGADLSAGGKAYCLKKRACTACMQRESVMLTPGDPSLHRFCQQCGKFQSLDKFDGTKRSCRARLAKRRSGTRAQLLKKGCTERSGGGGSQFTGDEDVQWSSYSMPLPQELATAVAAEPEVSNLAQQARVLAAEEQRLMFLLHQQEQQLGLQALMQQQQQQQLMAATAAATPTRAGSPVATDCGCTSSMSDGAAVPRASAAAASAAAAAAQASVNCALSAPLLLLDARTTPPPQQQQQQKQEPAFMAAGGTQPCVADSDAMLDGIMAQSEVEEALKAGQDQDSAGGWRQVPQQQQQGSGKQVTFAQQEASGCSIPLANLALLAAAPHSPVGSGMTGGCKSAPLPRWHTLPTMSAVAPPAVRAASAAVGEWPQQQQQQQQQHSSRLRWLLQQVQEELHTCSPAELDSLDNAELSTLLCAALAPEAVAAAAAADGGGDDDASPSAVTAAAESYIARAAAAACSGAPEASAGFAAAAPPALPANAGLAAQVEQVQQLQQQVEHLQLQLARAKESQAATRAHSMPGLNGAAAAAASLPQAAGCGFHAPPHMARTVSASAAQGQYSPVPQAPLSKARSSAATLAAAVANAAMSSELPPLHRAGSSANMAPRSLNGVGSGAFNNRSGAFNNLTSLPSGGSWGGLNSQHEARQAQAQQQQQLQQQLQWEQLVGCQQQPAGASTQHQQQLQQADALAQFARLQRQLEATEADISTLLRQRAGGA